MQDFVGTQLGSPNALVIDPVQEVMSSEEKKVLFSQALLVLREILNKYEIVIPSDNELLERLHYVNEANFTNIISKESNSKLITKVPGWCLSNGVVLINIDKIRPQLNNATGEVDEEKRKQKLLEIGLHELIHSISEGMLSGPNRGKLPEDKKEYAIGLRLLDEGFTQYLTELVLHKININLRGGAYSNEVREIIAPLIKEIGEQPVFKGILEKNGFDLLNLTLDRHYGEGALEKLALSMYHDKFDRKKTLIFDYLYINTGKLFFSNKS